MYTIPSASIPLAKICWFGIKKALLYALIAFVAYIIAVVVLGFKHNNSIVIQIILVMAAFLSIPSLIYTAMLLLLTKQIARIKNHYYAYIVLITTELHLVVITLIDQLNASPFRAPLIKQIIYTNQQVFEGILKPATILTFINTISFILPPIIAVFTLYRCQQQKQLDQTTT